MHVRVVQVRRQRVCRAAMGERAGGGAREEEAAPGRLPALHLRRCQQQQSSRKAARYRPGGAVEDGRPLRRLLSRPRRHP